MGDSNVAQAKTQYEEGLKTMTHAEIMAKSAMVPDHPSQQRAREVAYDKRPVWFGPYLKPPKFLPIPYSFRER